MVRLTKYTLCLALLLVILPVVARAGDPTSVTVGNNTPNSPFSSLQFGLPGGLGSSANPAQLVADIYNLALAVAGLLAFGSILYGGIMYLTTGGNTSAQAEAKSRIKDAIIGLLLLIGIYFVLNLINPDLTKLKFPTLTPVPPPSSSQLSSNNNGPGVDCINKSDKSVAKHFNSMDECTHSNCDIGTSEQLGTQDCVASSNAGVVCSNLPALAAKYNEPYPPNFPSQQGVNAPALKKLLGCMLAHFTPAQLGSVFTYDQSHPTCNLTRGLGVCDSNSSCSHATNSCHYGGHNGTEGALAVDYGNENLGGELITYAINHCGAKSGRCEGKDSSGKVVTINIDGTGCASGADHVHINAGSCDAN